MNKIEKTILTLLIGDYILDKMTENKRINGLPRPISYLRDKYLRYKIRRLE